MRRNRRRNERTGKNQSKRFNFDALVVHLNMFCTLYASKLTALCDMGIDSRVTISKDFAATRKY